MGGDVRDPDAKISSEHVHHSILEQFDLDVDLSKTFGVSASELTKTDLERCLLETRAAKRA